MSPINYDDSAIGICNSILIEDDTQYGERMTSPGIWEGESILTVSSETENHQFSVSIKKLNNVNQETGLRKHVLSSMLLSVSMLVFMACYTVLNIYEQQTFNRNVLNMLHIIRHVALYGFAGGSAVLMAIFVVFSASTCVIRKIQWEYTKDLIKMFVNSHIFDDRLVKNYFCRVKSHDNNESAQIYMRFIESKKFDVLLDSVISQFQSSPEGVLLGHIGMETNTLKTHAKAVMLDVLILFFQQVPLSYASSGYYNPKGFKQHVERLLNEQLSYACLPTVTLFVKNIIWQHYEVVVLIVWLITALFGACVGSVQLILQ